MSDPITQKCRWCHNFYYLCESSSLYNCQTCVDFSFRECLGPCHRCLNSPKYFEKDPSICNACVKKKSCGRSARPLAPYQLHQGRKKKKDKKKQAEEVIMATNRNNIIELPSFRESEVDDEQPTRAPKTPRFDDEALKDNKLVNDIKASGVIPIAQARKKKAVSSAASLLPDQNNDDDLSADEICDTLQNENAADSEENSSVKGGKNIEVIADIKIKKRKIARSKKTLRLYSAFNNVFLPTLRDVIFNNQQLTHDELMNMFTKIVNLTHGGIAPEMEEDISQFKSEVADAEALGDNAELYQKTYDYINKVVIPFMVNHFL